MKTKGSKEEEKGGSMKDGPDADIVKVNLNNIEGHTDFMYEDLLRRIFNKLKIDV